jgi:hypothetical protein
MTNVNHPRLSRRTLIAGLGAELALPAMSSRPQTRGPTEELMHSDFDFLFGSWTVEHRRLKHRLTHSDDWETFSGTCVARPILNGQANIDDNLLHLPAGDYRAASLRAFDPGTHQWSIWWLDSRTPGNLGPPVVGAFENGVGTFYGDDTFAGKPIVMRFLWSDITPGSAKWQQAFSTDRGQTWETNWIMTFRRAR